jgi:hypothetical protein
MSTKQSNGTKGEPYRGHGYKGFKFPTDVNVVLKEVSDLAKKFPASVPQFEPQEMLDELGEKIVMETCTAIENFLEDPQSMKAEPQMVTAATMDVKVGGPYRLLLKLLISELIEQEQEAGNLPPSDAPGFSVAPATKH